MNRKFPSLSGLGASVLAASLLGIGCQGSGALAKLQEQLAQINDKQDTILSRLDTLEGKIGKAPAPGAKKDRGPQPGRPDPKATYKVAVAPEDAASGPPDAKITIVEWSDFQ